jgi:hypothetical protein
VPVGLAILEGTALVETALGTKAQGQELGPALPGCMAEGGVELIHHIGWFLAADLLR